MRKNIVYSLVLVFVLMGVFGLAFKVQRVEASGTIYILATGEVVGTDKISRFGDAYYEFNDNINDSIVVQRSNIVIDGDGWTLDGLDFTIMEGLNLTGVSNVTIIDINIQRFASYSIYLKSASQCVISRNTVTGSEGGIGLFSSTGIEVSDNEITGCWEAVELVSSSGNVVSGNNITDNQVAVRLWNSTDNTIAGNNMTANNFAGVTVSFSSNFNTISGNNITDNEYSGIFIRTYSHNNTISRNILVNNTNSIDIVGVLFTTISRNHIAENNQYGIILDNASNNIISENNITNNNLGIFYNGLCNNNTAYHNNFIDNAKQVEVSPGDVDAWDDGVEGNYWSNYTGVDLNHDGIGDSWHEISENNTDHYPLMGLFHSFNTSIGEYVSVVSNSTVTYFNYEESKGWITIQVRNATAEQAFGFCRVCIPHNLMDPDVTWIHVVINDGTVTPLHFNNTLYDNGTHRWIYVAYPHSLVEIVIVPEFPSFLVLPLFMIATLLAVVFYRRRRSREG